MKVSEKLAKVQESFTVYMYDNGFLVEVSGRDSKEEWQTAKVMCTTWNEVVTVISEIPTMEREG
jgi:hypothetical protein